MKESFVKKAVLKDGVLRVFLEGKAYSYRLPAHGYASSFAAERLANGRSDSPGTDFNIVKRESALLTN
jgi:hypothetical protein